MLPTQYYSTEASKWTTIEPFPRFRQAIWTHDHFIYVYGGFSSSDQTTPISDFIRFDIKQIIPNYDPNANSKERPRSKSSYQKANPKLYELKNSQMRVSNMNLFLNEFHLASKVLVSTSFSGDLSTECSKVVRTLSISKLSEESKKLTAPIKILPRPKLWINENNAETLCNMFLNYLLKPKEWATSLPSERKFLISADHIIELTRECQNILERQPLVLKLRSHIKIFGDIHGQYRDLMR